MYLTYVRVYEYNDGGFHPSGLEQTAFVIPKYHIQ